MNYELDDKEFELLSTFWSTSLNTKDSRHKWEAEQALERLAIASRGTVQELIDEYSHPGDLDPDDWQPYGYEPDDLFDCHISPYGYD